MINSNDDSTTMPGAGPLARRPHLVVVEGMPTDAETDAIRELLKNPHREPAD